MKPADNPAVGQPATHPGPARPHPPGAEPGELDRLIAAHERAATDYRRLMDARDTHPSSVPWQDCLQAWQHVETAWDRLQQAEIAAGGQQAEPEAG